VLNFLFNVWFLGWNLLDSSRHKTASASQRSRGFFICTQHDCACMGRLWRIKHRSEI